MTVVYGIFLCSKNTVIGFHIMSINLSMLPADEKNKIELDKQASFLVWKLKQVKAGPEEITEQRNKIALEQEQQWFDQCVDKYKRIMGVA